MGATIRDIARLAGVSVATASMAINNKAGVNAQTRELVLDTARKLNYSPNQNARSLIMRKSGTIGLVVTDLTNPFFSMLVNEINTVVLSHGYNMLLGISNDTVENECRCINTFIGQKAEGIIIVPCAQKDCDLGHIHRLGEQNLPFVMATTAYPGIQADCVMTDLAKGSYLLTRHLLERGHRKIFLISGSRSLVLSDLRIKGYKQAYLERGIPCGEDWIIETTPNFEHGYEVTPNLLRQRPDAITTINDVLALGVLKYLKDNRYDVPGSISVAGYDDLLYTSILETPLTTVRQPVQEIALAAVEMLLNRIGGGSGPAQTQYVEPVLKIRATTR
jgi:DNA-binding LacI/PurR family transcriptional regulator